MDIDPKLMEENRSLLHAIQSGVAAKQAAGKATECEPKHLRVGINNALLETSAIVQTLAEAGIIDINEYFKNLNKLMKEEVSRYEQALNEIHGSDGVIKLA